MLLAIFVSFLFLWLTGRLPIGFLDNNLMRGDSYLLDQFTARKLCFPSKSGLGSQPALNRVESYSRKVFVGGLPPDIDEGISYI